MRGGKRPGAGAPRGNWNALRSGRYSPRLAHLFAAASKHSGPNQALRDLYNTVLLFRRGLLNLGPPPWAPKRRRRRRGRPRGPSLFNLYPDSYPHHQNR